jgi:prepilin-type N-terminal cleavage/methylation domain-containing protein
MPSRALTRRDPLPGKNGFSATRGFTLIELLVVVAVVAIITTLALPSYRAIVEKRQVTSGAQQLAAFVSSAQLEAVKRNQRVAVRYDFTDIGDWCVGIVNEESDGWDATEGCTCSSDPETNTCALDDTPRIMIPANLNYDEALEAIVGADDSFYVIDPVRGMMEDFTDAVSFELVSRPEQNYALNVEVGPTGRIRICSNAGDQKVPGFEEC